MRKNVLFLFVLVAKSNCIFQVVFPQDDLYPSLYDRVSNDLSHSDTGQVSILQSQETVAEYRAKAKDLNRIVLRSGHPVEILINVTLSHGQCSPVSDLLRIQELAKALQPQSTL